MHPTIRPDLRDACLEERILPAYSANIPGTILTTGGYTILTTPPGLSSALNNPSAGAAGNASGSAGGMGGNMSTSFNISGFGPSQLSIGNVTGYPALAGGKGGVNGSVSLPTTVGSGANDPNGGGANAPVSRFVFASGGVLTDPGGSDFLYIGQNYGGTSTGSTQGTSQQNGTNTGTAPAPQDNTPPPPPAPLPGAVPNNLAPPPTGVNTGTGVTGVKM